MRFAWDEIKKAANASRHPGITFEMAQEVFLDPNQVRSDNYFYSEDGEQRYIVIGLTKGLLLVVVVFVEQDERDEEIIRIISARKAENYEKKAYNDQFNRP